MDFRFLRDQVTAYVSMVRVPLRKICICRRFGCNTVALSRLSSDSATVLLPCPNSAQSDVRYTLVTSLIGTLVDQPHVKKRSLSH